MQWPTLFVSILGSSCILMFSLMYFGVLLCGLLLFPFSYTMFCNICVTRGDGKCLYGLLDDFICCTCDNSLLLEWPVIIWSLRWFYSSEFLVVFCFISFWFMWGWVCITSPGWFSSFCSWMFLVGYICHTMLVELLPYFLKWYFCRPWVYAFFLQCFLYSSIDFWFTGKGHWCHLDPLFFSSYTR